MERPSHTHNPAAPLNCSLEQVLGSSTAKVPSAATHWIEDDRRGAEKGRRIARTVRASAAVLQPATRAASSPTMPHRYLNRPRLQRFIGVLYCRDTKRRSHCSECTATDEYDALAIAMYSRDVQPLEWEDRLHESLAGGYDGAFPFWI